MMENSVMEGKMLELKCSRCGSERLLRRSIKRKLEGGIDYFEQILKCKECEQEMFVQVRV